jgi:integrase
MSLPSYLLCTSQGFFFRMRVPKILQPILEKRELKKAIRTTNRVVAERQAVVYAGKVIELFDRLMENPMSRSLYNDIPGLTQMVVRTKHAEFHLDPVKRREELQDLIDAGILKHAAEVEFVQPVPSPSLIPTNPMNSGLFLSEALEMFIKNKYSESRAFNVNNEKELRSLFNLLTESLGGDKVIGAISLEDAQKFRDDYNRLPRNRTSKSRQSMNLKELIALNDPVKNTTNTIAQRLDRIRSFFDWLNKLNPAIWNPFSTVKMKDSVRAINKRSSFSSEDLSMIFQDKIWTEKDCNHAWEYWLPLLVLYTGARITELCQLEKKDFEEIDGTWCMLINDTPTKDEPEEIWGDFKKRLKTKDSVRDIPVHSKLIELGFSCFVELSKGRIFPDIKPVAGKLAKEPCRRFNDFVLKRTGVKVPNVKTFYSFRHTTLNYLKQLDITSEKRAQLAGHSTASITENTYGNVFNIGLMKELIEKLDFSSELANVKKW